MASPAARVVPVDDAATTFGAAGAAPDTPAASPVDALLAARFSGKKKRRDGFVFNDGFEKPPAAARKGVDALVDVDGDGTGAPWYAGGTAEKKPKPAEKVPSKHTQKKETRATRAGTRRNESRRADRADRADRAEEEFAAALAEMAEETETRRADADTQRARSFAEAAAAKSAIARPPSSVTRAISFDEAKETDLVEEKKRKDGETSKTANETPAADALALFGASAPRFRGKRRVSASAPRRTPAAGVSAPKTKARDPRRSAMSLLGLGD
jgi:hypothetical protein